MILYQLTKDGTPFGEPMEEWKVDKLIKRTQVSISNVLGKVVVKPELKLIGGRMDADTTCERVPANA